MSIDLEKNQLSLTMKLIAETKREVRRERPKERPPREKQAMRPRREAPSDKKVASSENRNRPNFRRDTRPQSSQNRDFSKKRPESNKFEQSKKTSRNQPLNNPFAALAGLRDQLKK